METIIIATYVSAISTACIAIFAGVSLWLAFTIRAGDKMHRRHVRELFEAITISNILSNPEANPDSIHLEERVKAFKEFYRGETPIFD